jgi:hypothetical protein
VEQRADSEPEQRALVETRASGERAGEIRDALAVTLGVSVLRFDRFTPPPDDIDELALEVRRLAVDVGEVAPRAQLGEELMRAVERLERFAIASLSPMHLGLLTRRLRHEQHVLPRSRELGGTLQHRFRSRQVAALALDYAKQAICIAGDLRIAHLRRELHGGVCGVASAGEVATCDPHLDDIDLDLHPQRDVPKVAHELDGFSIGQLGFVPPLRVGVHHAEVVERDADVAHETHRAVVGEAGLVELERSREVAADVRDDAKVLCGDRGELGVTSADGALACVVVEANGLVELALLPPEHA